MKIGQGKDKVKEFLKENTEMCSEIESKVRDVFAKNSDLIPEETGEPSDSTAQSTAKEDDYSEFNTEDIE